MLTNTQTQTLKTDLANSEFSAFPHTEDKAEEIAKAYNLSATPTFIVWRTRVPTQEVKKNIVWTEYIARSVGERDAFVFMLSDGFVNTADANIRSGFQDVFSGAGGATTRNQLLAMAKRSATRAEKLFAEGTGSDAAPATMQIEGNLTKEDVVRAWELP